MQILSAWRGVDVQSWQVQVQVQVQINNHTKFTSTTNQLKGLGPFQLVIMQMQSFCRASAKVQQGSAGEVVQVRWCRAGGLGAEV